MALRLLTAFLGEPNLKSCSGLYALERFTASGSRATAFCTREPREEDPVRHIQKVNENDNIRLDWKEIRLNSLGISIAKRSEL